MESYTEMQRLYGVCIGKTYMLYTWRYWLLLVAIAMVQWCNGSMVQWFNGAMVHIIMVGAYYQAWWEERAEPY